MSYGSIKYHTDETISVTCSILKITTIRKSMIIKQMGSKCHSMCEILSVAHLDVKNDKESNAEVYFNDLAGKSGVNWKILSQIFL